MKIPRLDRSHRGKELGRVDHYVGHLLSASVHILQSVTDSLRQRMEVVQRDGHTRRDGTTVCGMTPGDGEVTETRRNNKPGGPKVPMALLERWERGGGTSYAFNNVTDEDV